MCLRKDQARRNAWAKSYIKAIIERDVKDISSINGTTLSLGML